jgi:FliI/YscN family ATPase
VVPRASADRIAVGDELLGRVVDASLRPVDGGPLPILRGRTRLHASPPQAMERRRISRPMALGIRAMDACLTVGEGQRLAIMAGPGVGKSVLLGMLARSADADVVVVGLVGERGREVREFIERDLGPEGLSRSVVVVATSDQPALVRIKAALVATTIAEHFRDAGADVLLMMDSVTRLATAQREVGLAIGEPPATRGYTPSVFAMLPRLLERAGTSPSGSITALYTVLVEGDDMNEPVADAVRSILDGHVVLSRELAHAHHYPAIDVLQSVSRLAPQLLSPEHLDAGGRLRGLMAAHKRAEDLIAIGAYVPGSDPRVDEARSKLEDILGFLRQGTGEPYSRDEALGRLLALAGAPGPVVGEAPPPAAPPGGLTGGFDPLPPGAQVVPA